MVDACSIRFLCELISISYAHAAFAQRWEGTTLVTNDAMASDGASSVLLLRTAYADGDSLRKLQWKIWVGDHVQVEARSFLKGVLARRDELALGRLDLEPFFPVASRCDRLPTRHNSLAAVRTSSTGAWFGAFSIYKV